MAQRQQPQGQQGQQEQQAPSADEELARLAALYAAHGELGAQLPGAAWLRTWDHSLPCIEALLTTARFLEALYARNISCKVFQSGLAVSNFRDKSTRTRFSFAGAADMLGLAVQELDEEKAQVAHGESTRETATMIAFQAQVVGIRDDLFLGEGHRYQLEVCEALRQAYASGVLAQRPVVVNLQSDEDHPTQALADVLHLLASLGCRSLADLRGRRVAVTWAHSPAYGKPLSVPQGLLGLLPRLGMHVRLAHPPGYELQPELLAQAERAAADAGGSLERCASMEAAFEGAAAVYPKSWAPLAVLQERTRLLRQGLGGEGRARALAELERRCLEQNAAHASAWECTEARMATTGSGAGCGRALYMHCLPADVSGVNCAAGEVAAAVFEAHRDALYRQAGHKPFVIAAMVLLSRFRDAPALARHLLARNEPRVLDF